MNFEVEKGGKSLSVYVLRPDLSADGTGGATPADLVKRAEKDTVFHYHAPTDTYVAIEPEDGASSADARALMDQVVVP